MFTRRKINNETPIKVNDMNISYAATREKLAYINNIMPPFDVGAFYESLAGNICYIPISYTPPTQEVLVDVTNLNPNLQLYFTTYLVTEQGDDFVGSTLEFEDDTTNLLEEALKIGVSFVPSANAFRLKFTLTGTTDIHNIVVTAFAHSSLNNELVRITAVNL